MLNKIVLFLSILSFSSTSYSIDFKKVFESEKGKEITINSDSLSIRNNEDIAIFYTNVVVKQGGLLLKSDEIIVKTESISDDRKKFKFIEFNEGVEFTAIGKNAKADAAVYDVDAGTINLLGNVTLEENGNKVKGDNFFYNVATGKSSIKSQNTEPNSGKPSKARVRATLTPEEGGDIQLPLSSQKILNFKDSKKQVRGKN